MSHCSCTIDVRQEKPYLQPLQTNYEKICELDYPHNWESNVFSHEEVALKYISLFGVVGFYF
jgi:hypothetical protein